MTDNNNKIKLNVNDIATGVYGFLLKSKLLTADEYHTLRSKPLKEIAPKENEEDGE